MGAEQSNNNRRSTPQPPLMSEAQVKRLPEAQRLQCKETLAKATAKDHTTTKSTTTNSTKIPIWERDRAPYQIAKDDLLNVKREQRSPQSLYPNLNEGAACSSATTHSSNFQNNNNFHQPRAQENHPFHQPRAQENNLFHQPRAQENHPFYQPRAQENNLFHQPRAQENIPFHQPRAQENNLFHQPRAQENNSFHQQRAQENIPFHQPWAQENIPFHQPRTQENNSFHQQRAQEDNLFHQPRAQENHPFHQPRAQENNLFHQPRAQEDNLFHQPRAQENIPCHQPKAQENIPFHQPKAQENNSFHQPRAQEDKLFHQPRAQENIPFHQPKAQENNLFHQPKAQDLVKNYGQAERFRPKPSAPPAPQAPAHSERPRSVSRNRNSPRQHDVFDCPTCLGRYGMRIYQCNNGHSSCDYCKTSRQPCGLCGLQITDRRNYEVENHVSQVKVPCPHTSDGCILYMKMAEMETHTKKCPFREQQCPLASVFGNCQWRGKLNQIASHFHNMHPTQRQTNVDTEMQLMNICNNSQQVHLVVLGVYNFLFHVKVSETDRNIYMITQLLGPKMNAVKWIYEIHVFNKNEKHKKYTFTDNCKSSSESVDDLIKEKSCAVLPVSYATTFINDGAVTYKFFIKKAYEGRKDKEAYRRKDQRGRAEGSSDQEEEKLCRSKSRDSNKPRDSTVRQWVNSNRK